MAASFLNLVSHWAVPGFILFVLGYGFFKGVQVFEVFAEGAKEGLQISVRLIPYLVGLFVAVAIFRDSGALDIFIRLLSPFLTLAGIPGDVVPIFFVRPLSGSVALAMTVELFYRLGPDCLAGRMASTIHGSTDTTFYVLSVYFASVGVKKFRYAIIVGLLGDLAGYLAAIFIVNKVFGA